MEGFLFLIGPVVLMAVVFVVGEKIMAVTGTASRGFSAQRRTRTANGWC